MTETAPFARARFTSFVSLGAGELVSRVIAFIATATLTRRLGASGFGELAFAAAISGYLLLVPNAALQDLGARAVAQDPSNAARIGAEVTRVRVAISLLGTVAVSLLALGLPTSNTVKALVALSSLSVVGQALNASWVYKALERTASVGVALVITQLVTLLGVVLLIAHPGDLLRVPAVQGAGELAAAIVLLPLIWRGWRGGSFQNGVRMLRGAGTVIVNRLLRSVIVSADMILLGFLAASADVGRYSAAYRVCFLLTAIATSAHAVFQPSLLRAHDDPDAASAVLTDSVALAGTVGMPLVVGGVIVAPDLLALLFGEPFRAAEGAFRILLIGMAMLFLHGTMQPAYLARRALTVQTAVIGGAAALNLGLNAVLIVPLGIVGAAIATAAAEAVILCAHIVILSRWKWRADFRVLSKPALAVAGMGVVMYLLPASWHVVVRMTAGGVAYLILLWGLGGIPASQLSAFPRRLPGNRAG